jgi:hypothetical protein
MELDCLSALAHGVWICIEALLHSFEQMLMLPSRNPPFWPRRALGFEQTILTGCGPVAPHPLAVFLIGEAIRQALACWTAIGVLLWQIDEVVLSERPSALAFDVCGFVGVTVMPSSWHARISGLLK